MKILRNQQFQIGCCKQAIAHPLRGVLLELHLRVTVSTFEKRCISVTGEVCDRIFVHALMQKCRDEEMPERVQVIGFRQTDFREQGFQVLAERVRVDGRAVVFCENVFREWDTMLIAESHFAIAEPAQQAEHFFVHRNSSGATIFRFTLLHTLAGNGAARVLDNDIALITAGHDHIRPAQGAQLTAPHPGVDGEEVEKLENWFFMDECKQTIIMPDEPFKL